MNRTSILSVALVLFSGAASAQQPNPYWHLVEANNGAVTAISVASLERLPNGARAMICDWDNGACFPGSIAIVTFDRRGHFATGMAWRIVAPRSVLGYASDIACNVPAARSPDDPELADRIAKKLDIVDAMAKLDSNERAEVVAKAAKAIEICIGRSRDDPAAEICNAELHDWKTICEIDTAVEKYRTITDVTAAVFDTGSKQHATLANHGSCSLDVWPDTRRPDRKFNQVATLPDAARIDLVSMAASAVMACLSRSRASADDAIRYDCEEQVRNWEQSCEAHIAVKIAGDVTGAVAAASYDANSPQHAQFVRERAANCSRNLWRTKPLKLPQIEKREGKR